VASLPLDRIVTAAQRLRARAGADAAKPNKKTQVERPMGDCTEQTSRTPTAKIPRLVDGSYAKAKLAETVRAVLEEEDEQQRGQTMSGRRTLNHHTRCVRRHR
jgi:hypothetical protein